MTLFEIAVVIEFGITIVVMGFFLLLFKKFLDNMGIEQSIPAKKDESIYKPMKQDYPESMYSSQRRPQEQAPRQQETVQQAPMPKENLIAPNGDLLVDMGNGDYKRKKQ